MLFTPKQKTMGEGVYRLSPNVNIKGCAEPILNGFYKGFCFDKSAASFTGGNENEFIIGNASPEPLGEYDYGVKITPDGVAVFGKDSRNALYGFFTFLELINPYDMTVPCCSIFDKADIEMRMTHLCIFPETSLLFIQKFIRFCAFLRYTHIVIEFWGMYKYTCLKELAWENAFSKEQLKPIFDEATALKVELVPMINHLGHASSCRLISGKHVVLDRNRSLFDLFEPDGWSWNTDNPKALELLRQMRREMLELFPNARLFHLGCDEVYSYNSRPDKIMAIPAFLNGITDELDGIRPIVWGDMLLTNEQMPEDGNSYELNLKDRQISEMLLERLDKRIIIADWQYGAKKAKWYSSRLFNLAGFDTLCCPWFELNNVKCAVDTVKAEALAGVLCTTWHTVNTQLPLLINSAQAAYGGEAETIFSALFAQGTSLLRKLMPLPEAYEDSGFIVNQITGYER